MDSSALLPCLSSKFCFYFLLRFSLEAIGGRETNCGGKKQVGDCDKSQSHPNRQDKTLRNKAIVWKVLRIKTTVCAASDF